MKKIILIVFMSLHFVGCDLSWLKTDEWWFIEVMNNSPETIYVCGNYILPDTLLPINKHLLRIVLPQKFEYIYDKDVNDTKFKRLKRDERLTVFILHKDTVDKYDWDIIRTKNMILKRYEFNDKELREMGGKLVYP
jgi:hypothetical protein